MKIVIGTSTPFHLGNLARELAEIGHEVTLIGYMPKWKIKKYNIGNVTYICAFWVLFPLAIFALQRLFPKIQRKATFFIMPFIDSFISKKISRCDVFIGLSGVTLTSFVVAKKKFNAITICDRGSAHVEVQNILIKSKSNNLPRAYVKRELFGYQEADYVVVPSMFALNSFISKGVPNNKIFMNNYGVNLERFTEGTYIDKTQNNLTINALFVGGWSYQKGVDLLNEAIDCDNELIITHIGSYGNEKIPSSTRFKSLGHISNDQLKQYYYQADVLILPSRQDGFGMVLLEALACGTPVIASRNTGAPDIKIVIKNTENVQLMDDVSLDSLISKLKWLREYRAQLAREETLTENDKSFFSWKEYGNRYNKILLKIT